MTLLARSDEALLEDLARLGQRSLKLQLAGELRGKQAHLDDGVQGGHQDLRQEQAFRPGALEKGALGDQDHGADLAPAHRAYV